VHTNVKDQFQVGQPLDQIGTKPGSFPDQYYRRKWFQARHQLIDIGDVVVKENGLRRRFETGPVSE
jgi:hypothetical protein